jgi:porin
MSSLMNCGLSAVFRNIQTWRSRSAGIGFASCRQRGLDSDTGFFGGFFYPVRTGETIIEMMYIAQLAPWWTLQPDVQYIIRPGGGVLNNSDGSFRPNAWVIAIRSALRF